MLSKTESVEFHAPAPSPNFLTIPSSPFVPGLRATNLRPPPLPFPAAPAIKSSTSAPITGSAFRIVFGMIPLSALYDSCLRLLAFVCPIAASIEGDTESAYKITFPFSFRLALPMVCNNERSFLRNPSRSASKIATSETSGISSPSLRRLIPTITSI